MLSRKPSEYSEPKFCFIFDFICNLGPYERASAYLSVVEECASTFTTQRLVRKRSFLSTGGRGRFFVVFFVI
jgi:hypothetical protein